MTESDWLVSTDPAAMLQYLCPDMGSPYAGGVPHRISDRKLRLFACACARERWHLLTDARSRKAVEVAEQFADGLATAQELDGAWDASWVAARAAAMGASKAASMAAAWSASRAASWDASWDASWSEQASLLRDIVGNPFQPAPIVEQDWRSPTVLAIAHKAYEDRPGRECHECKGTGREWVMERDSTKSGYWGPSCTHCHGTGHIHDGTLDNDSLAILADALEDAGCDSTAILDHLRSPGPHVRGCWVLDLILGKE